MLTELAEPSEAEKARDEKVADLFSRLGGFSKVRIYRVGVAGDRSGLKPGTRASCGSIDLTDDVIDNFEDYLVEMLGGGHYYLVFFKGGKYQEECAFDIDPAMFPPVDRRLDGKETASGAAIPAPGMSPAEVMALVQSQNQQLMERFQNMMERAMHAMAPRRDEGKILETVMTMQQAALAQSERANERMLALIQAQHGQTSHAIAAPTSQQPLDQLRAVGELVRAVDDIRGSTGERETPAPMTTADRIIDAIAKPAGERLVSAFFPTSGPPPISPPPTPTPVVATPAPVIPPTPPAPLKNVKIPHEARVMTPDELAHMKATRPPPGSPSRPATVVPAAPSTSELMNGIPEKATA